MACQGTAALERPRGPAWQPCWWFLIFRVFKGVLWQVLITRGRAAARTDFSCPARLSWLIPIISDAWLLLWGMWRPYTLICGELDLAIVKSRGLMAAKSTSTW